MFNLWRRRLMEDKHSPRYEKELKRIESMPHGEERGIACLNNIWAEIMGVQIVRRTKRKRVYRKLTEQEKQQRKQKKLDLQAYRELKQNPVFSDYDNMQLIYLGRYLRGEIPEEKWLERMRQTTGQKDWGIPEQ
jgi:hypothetical protein